MAVIHCDSSSVERLRISCPIALANTVRCFHDWQQLHQYSHGFIVDSDTSTSFEIYRSKRQTGSLAGWVKMVVGWRRRVVGNLAEEDGFMECVVQGNVFGVTRGTSHRFLFPRRPRNGPRSKGVAVATDGFARIRAISIVRVGIANVLHRVRSSELERGACLLAT